MAEHKRDRSNSGSSSSESQAQSLPKKKYSDSKRRDETQHGRKDRESDKRGLFERSKWDSPSDNADKKYRKYKNHVRSHSVERENKSRHSDDNRQDSGKKRKESTKRERDDGKQKDDRDDYERNKNRRHREQREGEGHKDNKRRYEHRTNRTGDNYRERDSYSRNNKFGNRRRARSNSFDHINAKWGKSDRYSKTKEEPGEKEKPNFGLSGKLTEETNTFKGRIIKYSEPPEARKPKRRWRLYPFKGEKAMPTLYIHRESGYLIGRDRKVVDIPVDHPSCSKQHAALQYRLVPFLRDDGTLGKRVRPYLIDLESANGTYINNKRVDAKKYIELLEKDVVKFGYSTREYVLLHENSKDEAQDDDVKQEDDMKQEDVPVKSEKSD